MRSTRRLVVPGRTALVGIGVAALLAGCSATNPATVATPYAASDGTAAELQNAADGSKVKLRNFLLVTTAKGASGAVAGAIANDGTEPVEVRLTVIDDTDPAQRTPVGQATVTVEPGALALVGPQGTALDVASTPAEPGTKLLIEAAAAGGSTTFPLPVLPAEREYSTITSSASPSAGESEGEGGSTPTPSESPSESSNG